MIKITLSRIIIKVFLGFILVFTWCSNGISAPYYAGKIIVFVCPFTAGGGTDIWTRLIAKHLGKFIPGNPNIVIRNMPAAQGLVGGNYVWVAKPNGLTAMTTAGTSVMSNLLRPKGIEFKDLSEV